MAEMSPRAVEAKRRWRDLYAARNAPGANQEYLGPHEHSAWAEFRTIDKPLLGPIEQLMAIPAYSGAKALGLMGGRSPASIDEMAEGYRGVGRGLASNINALRDVTSEELAQIRQRQDVSKMEAALRGVLGVAEPALTIGSSVLSSIPAGAAGLYDLIRGRGVEEAASTIQDIQSAGTYMPRTERGMEILDDVSEVMDYLGAPARAIGDFTMRATDSPAAATGAEAFLDPLNLIPGGKTLAAALPAMGIVARKGRLGIGGSRESDLSPVRADIGVERERMAYPGIYADTSELVDAVNVAPETGSLSRVFDTTRKELSETALARQEAAPAPGWRPREDPVWIPPGTAQRPKGNPTAQALWTPENQARLSDAWTAARERRPDLFEGMSGWYVSDPMYQRMVDLMGPEEAAREFTRREGILANFSPGAPVPLEINRGSRAAWLHGQGRFPEFLEHGGNSQAVQPSGIWANLPEMAGLRGHPYHGTSQAAPTQAWLDAGMQFPGAQPKVPAYFEAWRPTEAGFQTHYPVADAHWSRAMGLSDVRKSQGYAQSASTPEMTTLAPLYDELARQHGLSGVTGQALHWGIFSPQTGVKTAVGAPKLELIADAIENAAAHFNMPVSQARDMYIQGQLPIGGYGR